MGFSGLLLAVFLVSTPATAGSLEGVPAEVIARQADADDAALLSLSNSKLARVLLKITSQEKRARVFSEIAKDERRVLEVLLFVKEQPFDSKPDGSNARELLSTLSAQSRDQILERLARLDGPYAGSISAKSGESDGKEPPHAEKVPEIEVKPRAKLNDAAEYPEVSQREYLVTTADRHSRIETNGLGPCVAFTLYDPKTRTGALAHVDAPTRAADSLDRVLLEFTARGIPLERLRARVIGGHDAWPGDRHKTSARTAYDVIRRLTEAGIPIIERDLLGKDAARNIIFDLRNGRAYDLEHSLHWEGNAEKAARLWDAKHERFCDGYLYRHEASLPDVGVPTEQYEQERRCY